MKRILAALALLTSAACATNAPLPDLAQTPASKAPRFGLTISGLYEHLAEHLG